MIVAASSVAASTATPVSGPAAWGLEPFRHLVNDPRFRDLPMILETPKGIEDGEDLDTRNLKVLLRLVRPARACPKARLMLSESSFHRNFRGPSCADARPRNEPRR